MWVLDGSSEGNNDHRSDSESVATDDHEAVASTKTKRFAISSAAVLSYAELALGYNLSGLRRGISAVLRSERGLAPSEAVEPDTLTLFAFSLAAAPHLVAEWTAALNNNVARFADCAKTSFVIRVRAHGNVRIVIKDNAVTAVLPALRQTPEAAP
jgi:hypothetical protein